MKKYSLLLALTLIAGLAQAAVYKWVDSQGNVHFSDSPHSGAQQIEVPPSQLYSSPPPAPAQDNQSQDQQSGNQEIQDNQNNAEQNNNSPISGYQSLTIIQPVDQATVRNNQGMVSVASRVVPNRLQQGDRFQLIYDGEPLGSPQITSSFILNNVYRGTHTISIQIVDSNGKVQISSDTVTFYMHRAIKGKTS